MYKVVPLLFGVALLFFFWGLVKFLANAGDKGAIEEGRNKMLWGVITLFVMLSVWSLVRFIQHDLNITNLGL